MKIILIKDYPRLGSVHDVLEVRDGYARNYLIPFGIATIATKGALRHVEEVRKYAVKAIDKRIADAEAIATKINDLTCTLKVNTKDAGEDIYGSVGAQEIIDVLKAEGVELTKSNIMLPENFKKTGVYEVKIRVLKGVDALLKLWIVKAE